MYYNDNEPFVVAWLRKLIAAGYLPAGPVDERSIGDVQPSEIARYEQAHFFCGIAGWPLALKLAGWPDEWPVWTGSCPCQPFSVAGKRQAHEDARDLWPAFFRLIAQCRPAIVFGEQVAGAIAHGWLDRICDDLEREDYAVGATVLPACSVGAPHIRARLYWVAIAQLARRGKTGCGPEIDAGRKSKPGCPSSDLGDADAAGPQGWGFDAGKRADQLSPWAASQLIQCLDGKQRQIPLERTFQPLVDGVSRNRMGILRGAGNAIVVPLAAAFIKVVMEILQEKR